AHQCTTQSVATVPGQHENVGEIRQRDPVRQCPCETDHPVPLVTTDHPPRALHLGPHIVTRSPPGPVRLRGQELPHRTQIDPRGIVVNLVTSVQQHTVILARTPHRPVHTSAAALRSAANPSHKKDPRYPWGRWHRG